MTEKERVIKDVNSKWLCQTRFIYTAGHKTKWHTVYIAESKEQAQAYFDNAPDWVNNF